MKKTFIYFFILLSGSFVSCEKYLNVDAPIDKLDTKIVFSDSSNAALALIGSYGQLMNGNLGFVASQGKLTSLCADDIVFASTTERLLQFYENTIFLDNSEVNTLWANLYLYVYQLNNIIEGVDAATGISPTAKVRLTGEAKFLRAFLFFYLVNNWGDVPLTLTTDYRVNEKMQRTATTAVYQQIVEDLLEAQDALPLNYPTTERLRPNKRAATALLARTYLYMQEWQKAEDAATILISDGQYLPLPAPELAFLKQSREIIWQMMDAGSSSGNYNAYDGSLYVPSSLTDGVIPFYQVRPALVNSFENNDLRKASWIGVKDVYYFPYKYKVRSGLGLPERREHTVVLRLAEQYLIRAEARAQLKNFPGAIEDLNVIRQRAGIADLDASLGEAQVISAIETERAHELFSEWGHRWFDLKRTGRADAVLAPVKGSNWESTDVLWPIPMMQRLRNPFLTQNDGY